MCSCVFSPHGMALLHTLTHWPCDFGLCFAGRSSTRWFNMFNFGPRSSWLHCFGCRASTSCFKIFKCADCVQVVQPVKTMFTFLLWTRPPEETSPANSSGSLAKAVINCQFKQNQKNKAENYIIKSIQGISMNFRGVLILVLVRNFQLHWFKSVL